MPKKPNEPERDPFADDVDELLKQLPEAETGSDEPASTAGVAPGARPAVGGAHARMGTASGPRGPTRRDKFFVWGWAALAVVIALALTQWPYVSDCGLPLWGFVVGVAAMMLAGLWTSVAAWRWRLALSHLVGLIVIGWGGGQLAAVILPRTGYAQETASWRCAPPAPPAVADNRGVVRQDDGTLLYYREVGSSPPSVIISSAGVLDASLARLGESAHVVFYDSRHMGRSTGAPEGGWDVQTQVEDLTSVRWSFVLREAELMDTLYAVGWSYMGPVVAQYASQHPDHIQGIVLIGSLGPTLSVSTLDPSRGLEPDTLGTELLRLMRARGDDQDDVTQFCRLVWEIEILWPRVSDPSVVPEAMSGACEVRPAQYADWAVNHGRLVEAMGEWDFTAAAEAYTGPVLVIHGTDDPIPMDAAMQWVRRFPNARLLRVQGAGNLPWLEQPDAVMQALQTFINGSWPEEAVLVVDAEP